MARLEGVPDRSAGLLARVFYGVTRRRFGEVLEPARVTAHHTRILAGYGAFEYALDGAGRVDRSLKELASLKAAAVSGCEFCIDIGSAIARGGGVREEQLRELHRHSDSKAFSELEKLVLDYARGMSSTPVTVSDELFARLRAHFDEGQLVELSAAIALENYRARFNWALGIESQDFSRGAFCPMPEAQTRTDAPAAS